MSGAASSLLLDAEQRSLLKRFHDAGLVWLVNAAVLHPRGWALTIHIDEDGWPIGLSIQGDGVEPWVYGSDAKAALQQIDGTVRNFLDSEAVREQKLHMALGENR